MKLTRILALCALVALIGQGCQPTGVRYMFDAPKAEVSPLKGLNGEDEIIEVTDFNGTNWAEGNNLFTVIHRGDDYLAGRLDLTTGQVSDLAIVPGYKEEKPLYWTRLEEDQLSGLGKCWGGCMASTPCGGTTGRYGFNAEKIAWGNENKKVMLSYQFEQIQQTQSTGYRSSQTVTTVNAALTQKFIEGDTIITIEKSDGFYKAFNSTGNIKRARYYPIDANTYLSFQPDGMDKDNKITDFITYNLKERKSMGADLDFPGDDGNFYVDGGVTRDGALVAIVTGEPGKYKVNRYNSTAFVKAVRLFRAVNQ
jgi:hypothetical protein